MASTIFYAWQSDLPGNTNRNFIERAIKDAIDDIHAGDTLESAPRFEFDKDTQGVPGSPAITDTIFDKIDKCGAFVADVTPVVALKTDEGTKLIPNPNVLIELGYAVKSAGWERIIMVMNTAFGSPADLPFDLRQRRWPITYQLAEDAGEKATERLALTSKLTQAIRAVTAIAPAPTAVSDEYAKERREEFQTRVLSGKFNDLTADYGILALFICPEAPIPRLDLPKVKDAHAIDIMPLDGHGNRPLFAGRSILTNIRYRDDAPIHAVTEFTDQGIIMAVDADYLAKKDDPGTAKFPTASGYVPSLAYGASDTANR